MSFSTPCCNHVALLKVQLRFGPITYAINFSMRKATAGTGTTTAGRDKLEIVLSFIRAGDTLRVTRIDRPARSVKDLEAIVDKIRAKEAFLRATEQPIDTSTPAGIAFLQMLKVFAQFDTAIRRERQMEGIAKAKAANVYKGRKPSVPVDDVRRLPRRAGIS